MRAHARCVHMDDAPESDVDSCSMHAETSECKCDARGIGCVARPKSDGITPLEPPLTSRPCPSTFRRHRRRTLHGRAGAQAAATLLEARRLCRLSRREPSSRQRWPVTHAMHLAHGSPPHNVPTTFHTTCAEPTVRLNYGGGGCLAPCCMRCSLAAG
jgi:hypothetical protein